VIRIRKRKALFLQIIIFSLYILIASGYSEAAVWFVDESIASSGDGTSWSTAFKTITEAINTSSAGDTINVAAGIYQERLVIDRQLTLVGDSWDSTIVQPLDTPTAGVYDVEVRASGTTIENIQFDFNGTDDTRSGNGIVVSDLNQPPVTDVQILNNKIYTGDANTGIQTGKYSDVSGLIVSGNIFYGDSDGMGEGIYVNPYSGAGKVTIENNEIYGYLYSGISIEAGNVDVINNIVDSDIAKGFYGVRFIELTGGVAFSNVTISHNNIQNVQDGISVGTSTDVGSTLTSTIQWNRLSANDVGLLVRYGADLTITDNNISGNTQYGVSNETTALVVAENNWWGDVSGPYHPVTNPAGAGDVVSDNVDYDPWITSVQANFTANPTSGVEPLTVSFLDTSTGPVDSWQWDFDNDSVIDSTEQNPTHTYTAPGTYTVSLTISGPLGPDIQTKINYITVDIDNPPQFIDFSPPDTTTGVELSPTLNWTATDPDPGDTITYDVYFGDASSPPLVSINQTSNTYTTGALSALTTYYWQIVARDAHGGETVGPVLSFTTLDNPPQFISLSPVDGATGISLTPTLTWAASDPDSGDTITYDVYFGTSSPPPLIISGQGTSTYNPAPLTNATVYYWKVVATDNHGLQAESAELSFTTLSNPPQILSFSPDNGSTGISLTPTLSWTATDQDPNDTLVYDVYFGTTTSPPLVSSNQTASTYEPGMLSYSTRYYWRIVARDTHGVETSTEEAYFDTVSIDIVVDHSAGNVSYPQITTDGNGHVYVVWEDTRNGSSDIYFNYSFDFGLTWSAEDIRIDTDVPGANHSNSPQIACDNSGHVYVVWEDERNGSSDIYFNYSSDFGATWQSSDIKLSTVAYAPPPQFPKIACDNSGHVYVAWDDNYFNTSADYGATWLPQSIRISNAGGLENQLICDQNGHVYTAWRSSQVRFNFSLDYGNTWQAADRIISSAGAVPCGISMDTDNSGHVYVTWHDGRNNPGSPDIYFNSSSDSGNTWGATDIKLNTGTPGSTYSIWPKVASDENGHVYVTWYDRRNGLGDIYINSSSDYGINWQTSDTRLDTDTPGVEDSGYPEVIVDTKGYIYVVWNDNQAGVGGPGIYMNYSPDYGSTWLATNEKIGSGGLNPRITSDSDHLYLVRDNSDIIFTGIALLLPMYPSPDDGAYAVSLTPTLSWRGGNLFFDDGFTYDVYFGTSSPPPLVSSNQTGTSYIPGMLNYFSTYYWQIVSKNGLGSETPGPIWSFTTISNPPEFGTFSPSDGAIDVDTLPTLSWSATDPNPGDTITFDVYFGNTNPPALKLTDQTSTTYTPVSHLSSYATYYWKIVARDNHGTETASPVLSFTTLDNPPQFVSNSPDDGATDISQKPTLTWYASDPDFGDTVAYDIYFGTSNPPPLVITGQANPRYKPGESVPLNAWTVYYWKIVARDNHSVETESPIFSFRTLSNPPSISNYSPANKTVEVSVIPTLSWTASDPDPGDTLTYDIYFGRTNPPPLVPDHPVVTNYQPGELSYSIKYFWKIVARDNHGIETAGPVLSFITFSRPPEFQDFTPLDLSTDIDLNPTLSWSASDPDPEDTLVYDVYFGFSPNPVLVVTNKKSMNYNPGQLISLTKYYWKIVARDNRGKETTSPVMSFITTSKPPQLTNLRPVNHSTGVSTTPTLTWWAYDEDPGDTVTCNVYFGTSSDPPLVVSNQVNQSYSPGKLEAFTTYYWKIVARDNHGDETVGPILSFTTNMISSISPTPPKACKAGRIAHIWGKGFGDIQGTGEIHLGSQVFGPGSPRIKYWSDTEIDFRIPPFNGWPPGTLKKRKVWVTINGVDSNKVTLKIRKPRD
jgi:PKD repeat protein/nitrous oxidase accessory protein NosD